MKKVGVFETFRSYPGGRLWRFDDHWARWNVSAQLCGITLPVEKSAVEKRLQAVLVDGSEVRLRLWSDGEAWELEVSELPEIPEVIEIQDQVFGRTNPQAKHDGHDYDQFFTKNLFETIWFDAQDNLLEGNITNVFAVIDGQLRTPKTDKILPGLMRDWVTDNFPVIERDISRIDLANASEIFLTNMVRGIVPVAQWGSWTQTSFESSEKIRTDWQQITCQNPVEF